MRTLKQNLTLTRTLPLLLVASLIVDLVTPFLEDAAPPMPEGFF